MRNRFEPPQNNTTTLRLRPGSYKSFAGLDVEFYQYYKHFCVGKNRSFICSKVWEEDANGDIAPVAGKCLGCDEIDNGNKGVSKQLLHAFHGIHMAWFHLVQAEDRNGKPITTRDGKPAMNKMPCKGRVCDLCKQKAEKIFGKAVYFPVGVNHFGNLGGFVEEIEKNCVCGGTLTPVTYGCIKCGTILLDVADCEMSDEDIIKWAKRSHKCSECGYVDVAIPELECSDCKEPRPLSIFDVDIDIKKHGEGTKSALQIPRWAAKDLSEELEKMPMPDLSKVLKGSDFDFQAKCLGIDNPYGKGGEKEGDHAEDYDEAKDPDEEQPY